MDYPDSRSGGCLRKRSVEPLADFAHDKIGRDEESCNDNENSRQTVAEASHLTSVTVTVTPSALLPMRMEFDQPIVWQFTDGGLQVNVIS